MNEYYLFFIKEKLKADILQEIKFEEGDKEIIVKELNQYLTKNKLLQEKKNQCKARIWDNGYGGQCSHKSIHNGTCKKHKGDWWLGMIDEPRPERPVHPNGKVHVWIDN